MQLTSWDEERAMQRIRELEHVPGAMLPMLHALQEEFGHVPDQALPLVAASLNVSKADVVGVVSFYPDFRSTPAGRHVLKVCRAEACQAMGCAALVRDLEAALGTAVGDTTPDGQVTSESVYCLGNCALSPAVMLDGRLYGRMTAARVMDLLERTR